MSSILLENGDALLREDGGFLLLEGGVVDILLKITEITETN